MPTNHISECPHSNNFLTTNPSTYILLPSNPSSNTNYPTSDLQYINLSSNVNSSTFLPLLNTSSSNTNVSTPDPESQPINIADIFQTTHLYPPLFPQHY